MLKAIRLKNFRSFRDTDMLALKPITLFLGQNSSGKSSVLRTIPLIKQSLRTPSNAPVLWYGAEVDYGTIEDVQFDTDSVDGGAKEDVSFTFYLDKLAEQGHRRRAWYYDVDLDLQEVELEIFLTGNESGTSLSGFRIKVHDDIVSIKIDKNGGVKHCFVGSEDYTSYFPVKKVKFETTNIVPQIRYIELKRKKNRDNFWNYYEPSYKEARTAITKFFRNRLHSAVSSHSISNIIRKIGFSPNDDFSERLFSVDSDLQSWKKLVKQLKSRPKEVAHLKNLFFLSGLPFILDMIDGQVDSTYRHAAYIGPSRATGERYYRHQELAVDQIDSQGQNLAMFLSSLDRSQQAQFSDWLKASIGSEMRINPSGGHIKIELKPSNAVSWHNLADMGYGFSQILPVMAQIWFQQSSARGGRNSPLIAIEQPELHLHPAYQGMLADIFATAISNPRHGPLELEQKFIIETHSESFINRLGDLVDDGKISKNDITIYVFDKTENDRETNIREVKYDSNGSLLNWPVGFFSSRKL